MTNDFYTFALTERRRMLADAGFARDDLRIWAHPDGRAIGEGVAAALTDEAFLRFLEVEVEPVNGLPQSHTETEREEDEGTRGQVDREI
ncbi:MAG TPA: hypothetical protein VFV58_24205 [Blastocatellia bacterium]|nr:hypothetical protein [Blastocatellia bacterium]